MSCSTVLLIARPSESRRRRRCLCCCCSARRACSAVPADYGKAVLGLNVIGAAIMQAADLGVPVYVDPKSNDFGRYRGATCITPNQRELALAARMPVATDAEIIAAATKIMHDSGAD